MLSVRNKDEYPSGGEVQGATRFNANLMRPVVVKQGQAVQTLGQGNITSVATTYAVLPSDGIVELTGTATFTATLPAITAVPKGWSVLFKKTGASGVNTISRAGSDTIDGATTVLMYEANAMLEIMSDGTNWIRTRGGNGAVVQSLAVTGVVADATDVLIFTADVTATLTLPAAAAKTNRFLYIKKDNAAGVNTITVTRVGGDTIDGATTYAVTAARRAVILFSDGTKWYVISSSTPAAG